jgi:hypothetical protein
VKPGRVISLVLHPSTYGAADVAALIAITQTAALAEAVSPAVPSLLRSEARAAANASIAKEVAVPIHANEHSS